MSGKSKTMDVTIMGHTYKVACADDEREALLAAVEHLDQKMNEIKSHGKVASAERIAVMAGLNIAHELLASRQGTPSATMRADNSSSIDIESVKRRMASMQATLDQALAAQEKLL